MRGISWLAVNQLASQEGLHHGVSKYAGPIYIDFYCSDFWHLFPICLKEAEYEQIHKAYTYMFHVSVSVHHLLFRKQHNISKNESASFYAWRDWVDIRSFQTAFGSNIKNWTQWNNKATWANGGIDPVIPSHRNKRRQGASSAHRPL